MSTATGAPVLLYVVAARVPRRETIVAGSLGAVALPRGWYAYVGSARRGRSARVARHMRADKPLRWHADYVFSRYPATRAWFVDVAAGDVALPAAAGSLAPLTPDRSAARPTSPGSVVPSAPPQTGGPAECTLAAALAAAPTCRGRVIHFGASDCGCPGHLLRYDAAADLAVAVRSAAASLGAMAVPAAAPPPRRRPAGAGTLPPCGRPATGVVPPRSSRRSLRAQR